MCKVPVKLRELVKQRLAAAAEEIFELLERTITEYEEELICKYDQQRKLDKAVLYTEEFDEVLTTTQVSMKSEEEEETWTQPVHHNQTVDCPEPPVPVAASGDHLLHLNNTEAEGTRGTQSDIYTLENNIKTEPLFIDEPQEGDTTFSQNTLSSVYSKRMYPLRCVCLKCGKAFPWKSKLERHMRVHIIKKTFSCLVCGKKASSKWHLQTHMKTHVDSTAVDCGVSVKNEPQFSSNNLENKTETTQVPGSSDGYHHVMLSQNECSSVSEKKNNRFRHRYNFGSRRSKAFAYKSKLERHVQVQTGAKLGENKQSSNSDQKHKEISKCHNCLICGKAFKWRSNLERHIRVHTGEKPYSCPVCGKGFSRQYHVRSHMKIHTRDESYSCSVCKKRFSEKDTLQTHMMVHLNSDIDDVEHFGEGSSSDRLQGDNTVHQNSSNSKKLKGITKCHKCLFCGKLFSKKSLLERHLRVHTGEKPYSCPVCGKRFTRQYHVRSHMNTHSGDEPYSCSVLDQPTEGGSLIYCSIIDD